MLVGDVDVPGAAAPVPATLVSAEAPQASVVAVAGAPSADGTSSGNYTQFDGFGYIATDMVRMLSVRVTTF